MCIGGPLHLQSKSWDGMIYRELIVVELGKVNIIRPTSVKYERVRSIAERFLTFPWKPFKIIDTVMISLPPPDIPTTKRRYRASVFAMNYRRCYFFIYESLKDAEALEIIEDSHKAVDFFRRNATDAMR